MSNASPYAATLGEQPSPKKRFRWRLIVAIFVLPIVTLWLVVFLFRVGWTIRENQGRGEMASKLHQLADDGFAIDNETISEQYASRTSNENTQQWIDVFAVRESSQFAESALGVPMLDGKVEIDDFADDFEMSNNWKYADACIRFTREQNDLIEQVRQLASDPTPVYFPIHFQSTETLLPEVQSCRDVARMIRVDAQVAIHLMDTDRAFKDLITLFALTKQVDAVPCVIPKFVGIAIRRMAIQILQRAIQLDLLTEQQLLEIDQIIKPHCDIGARWQTIMIDEMALSLPVFVNPGISMQFSKPIPARGHDAVYFIDLMRRAREIPTDDWQKLYTSTLELETEISKSVKSIRKVDLILTGIVSPAFNAIAVGLINDSQLHRQARVAIAIRLYSHKHSELPSRLDQLPEYADGVLNPIGDRSFGYIVTNRQSVLWGFYFSKEQQQTPPTLPVTDQPNQESSRNRESVWWFD